MFGAFLGPQDRAKIDPRSPQDGLKTDQKSYRFLFRFYHRFLVVLGSLFGALLDHLGVIFNGFVLVFVLFRGNRRFRKKSRFKTRLGTILDRFGRHKGSKMEAFWDLSWVKKS